MSGLSIAHLVNPRRTMAVRLSQGITLLLVLLAGPVVAQAADATATQRELLAGNYSSVIRTAQAAIKDNPSADWSLLLIQALLTTGKNREADAAMAEALARDPRSIRLRWLARDVAFANGRPEEAAERIDEIRRSVRDAQWLYRNPADLIVFGLAILQLGADPRDVLDKVFAVAQKADPKLRDVYLARGEVAMEKHDFALAAKAFEEGLKIHPADPDLLSGRAQAYADGSRDVALKSLAAALDANARHVPTLLQYVDHHIDAEAYTEASKVLDEIIEINPVHPEAWAYRSVIAHLRNDPEAEKSARDRALASWARNPRVDQLIGEKLSAKYRFAEGAAAQRRALAFDPDYIPAASSLATDLLRLGEHAEGWDLAQKVHAKDDYDVEAFNLVTLRDTMNKYASLENEDFVIRMAAPEVAVYGPRVLALLRRAKQVLVTKYGVELAKPTFIEIFADQKDFAVRTFGLPDVAGFLGVCFGRVVTANSPATSSSPTNWEAVLWHEFCHVVTLQMTKNKMPRWLSEGISVYEERQADPAWGMRIDPTYREMLLGDDLVPVGKLSAAFLAPKSSRHLQFAYLQSSLVVEFIVGKFGIEKIRGILGDLRDGMEINAALAKHTVPLESLESQFKTYAVERAQALAPKLEWEKPDPDLLLPSGAAELAAWERKHPDNYWLLRLKAQRLMQEQKWEDAKVPLQRLIELYPQQKGSDSAYRPLVAALKALSDTPGELAVLRQWCEIDDEATDAYVRLMELAAAQKDWPTVARNAERYLAVNPLVPPPYRYLAQATTETGDFSNAIVASRTLIQLDVPDRADVHYQLARLLQHRGDVVEARRHAVLALEETPRYRAALSLLLDLSRPPPAPEQVPVSSAQPLKKAE